MTTAGEMVKKALKERGLTQSQLAERIGKDQTLISRFISGVPISESTAISIARVLGLNVNDFLIQLRYDKLERKRKQLKTQFRDIVSDEDLILPLEKQVLVGHVGMTEAPSLVTLPLLNSVPYDISTLSKMPSETFVVHDIGIDKSKSFALRVNDDDLTDEKIDRGDIIIVDASSEINDGDRIIVFIGEKPKLKKIYRSGNISILHGATNEPPIALSPNDKFKVIGKVVVCIKQFVK